MAEEPNGEHTTKKESPNAYPIRNRTRPLGTASRQYVTIRTKATDFEFIQGRRVPPTRLPLSTRPQTEPLCRNSYANAKVATTHGIKSSAGKAETEKKSHV